MKKSSVFVNGVISYSTANIAVYLLSLFSIPLYINHLGPVQYGLWVVIQSLISYLSNAQFGLGTVASVLIAKSSTFAEQKTILKRSIDILLIIAGLLMCFVLILIYNPKLAILLMGKVPQIFIQDASFSFIILYISFVLILNL